MLGYKSSSFEWVLAQIGDSFPSLVIMEMLLCSIKEMCTTKKFKHVSFLNIIYVNNVIHQINICFFQTEKLNSFIRILDHLSITYFNNIKDVVFKLFKVCKHYRHLIFK